MVSQVSSNIGTFLTKAQEMCQTVRTAAATKANAIATSLWEKMGNHQYIANAAVKAIDKMSGTALKTVTKVYLQTAKPEEKIKELKEQLKDATKSLTLRKTSSKCRSSF